MAARVMMSAVREEAAMVSTEALAAARSTVTTEAGAVTRQAAEAAFNPLAAKEAAEANARNVVHTTGRLRFVFHVLTSFRKVVTGSDGTRIARSGARRDPEDDFVDVHRWKHDSRGSRCRGKRNA
ncbi:hypothetical protein A1Q2_00036 [Trichosporon asahii var. asahii CBS 8904]|uniref:Uncharacterized protein n=1 Tax=Trichosporon asahii var. asahii (strain CBS 8904) TaxID=1220162 RepID=K1VNA5_TRIAC|nr:hypothetical protein A1Q2_00036 [Trichosporon asahii var. asahii CBS 8904]